MPPKRNGRSTKAGLRRIDAAYDALHSLGFSRTVIRKNVNKLLKEYGQSGCVFIEESSYSLLIETILEEQEREGTVGGEAMANGQEITFSHHLQKEATDDQAYSMSIRGKKLAIEEQEVVEARKEPDKAESSMRDPIIGEQVVETGLTNLHNDALPHLENRPRPIRTPCYGWLSEEED